ncbi:hypothetical protein [Actinomadura latina]|uniref:Uncharacterized protein n=1 Tax=Actinomadura latina TaxID=163603 RepID=A0A846YUR8_9ACTN|nr:hypothetical protein [Actinomadura latina]NKZ02372.1 hypothetical protein [Actinomadura latina]
MQSRVFGGARTDDLGERTSIILDPTTYAYLGTRQDVARAHTWKSDDGKPMTTKPGTILSWYAELTRAARGRTVWKGQR